MLFFFISSGFDMPDRLVLVFGSNFTPARSAIGGRSEVFLLSVS